MDHRTWQAGRRSNAGYAGTAHDTNGLFSHLLGQPVELNARRVPCGNLDLKPWHHPLAIPHQLLADPNNAGRKTVLVNGHVNIAIHQPQNIGRVLTEYSLQSAHCGQLPFPPIAVIQGGLNTSISARWPPFYSADQLFRFSREHRTYDNFQP